MPAIRSAAVAPCVLAVAMTLAGAAGCQFAVPFLASSIEPMSDRPDSQAKPAPSTVPMEVLFVKLANDDEAVERAVWDVTDEQRLDGEVRHRLAINGIRVGILSSTLPEGLRRRIDEAAIGERVIDEPLPPSHRSVSRRTLRLLPGKESRLVSRASIGELVVFEHGDEGVRGRTFREATSGLVLSTWPAADGRIRLAAIPMIEHGPQRRTWTGEEGIFRLESGQSRHAFDSLRVEAELSPENYLVVGPVERSESSVASALFGGAAAAERRIFLIRPLARQEDPMFESTGEEGDSVRPDRPVPP